LESLNYERKNFFCNFISIDKSRLDDIYSQIVIIINKGGLVMTKSKSNQEFKTGDMVKLISGGPIMTVKDPNYLSPNHVLCQWFAGKKLEYGEFPPGSLNRASVDEKEK